MTNENKRRPASLLRVVLFGLLISSAIAVLMGLGVWQLQRRVWKLDLIAQVDQRVHAAPVSAPGPSDWPNITAGKDAYRHVRVTGRFTGVHPALVQAVTELGGGYWVLAPFKTDEGFVVFINRGFIPTDHLDWQGGGPLEGHLTITGLLRVTEPRGAFLHHNDPAADRWYSRDIAAIAESRRIQGAAPYFIDADASSGEDGAPIGGLTVISFPNNHLVYALTWFGLAAMLAGWSFFALRQSRRGRRKATSPRAKRSISS